MESVTFYQRAGFKGNSRTYDFEYTSDYQILLYNNPTKEITIRSISNNMNYFITLYYKKDENAFGGTYINIKEDLNDINLIQHTYYTFWSQEVSPEFNGIVLQKILPQQTWYRFNIVLFSENKKPYGNAVLDLTDQYYETIVDQTDTNSETDSTSINVDSTTAPTTLNTAPVEIKNVNDPYTQCMEDIKVRQQSIDIFKSRIENCEGIFNRDVLPLINQQRKLEETFQELEKQNTELKSNNNGSNITVFVIIVDLLILFYILYQHNIFRPLQHL